MFTEIHLNHKHFFAVRKFYAPTRIRISVFDHPHVCEFDTKTFETLIEHALINKLRQLPWQRWTCVGNFRSFTSSFWNVTSVHVRLQKFPTLENVVKNLWLQCAFSPSGYVWTQAVTAKKCQRIQTKPDTYGRVLRFLPAEIDEKSSAGTGNVFSLHNLDCIVLR